MSTHSLLGVKFPDGKITGCYVHYDGATMEPRIKDFISSYTTTSLVLLIARAQGTGGMRAFHCPKWSNGSRCGDPETEFLDDDKPYVVDDHNWDEDHFGTSYRYLVEYETGTVEMRDRYA